jgi:hypothetical protein
MTNTFCLLRNYQRNASRKRERATWCGAWDRVADEILRCRALAMIITGFQLDTIPIAVSIWTVILSWRYC